MYQIKTEGGVLIEAIDGPTDRMTPQLTASIFAEVNANKLRVFETAGLIEKNLEILIAEYLFGRDDCNKARKAQFVGLILNLSWFSFENKRSLALKIIQEWNLLEGPERNDFEKIVRRTISIRNAFTHGDFSTDGRKVKLAYFEGSPQSRILTDDYLQEVERTLRLCFKVSFNLQQRAVLKGHGIDAKNQGEIEAAFKDLLYLASPARFPSPSGEQQPHG